MGFVRGERMRLAPVKVYYAAVRTIAEAWNEKGEAGGFVGPSQSAVLGSERYAFCAITGVKFFEPAGHETAECKILRAGDKQWFVRPSNDQTTCNVTSAAITRFGFDLGNNGFSGPRSRREGRDRRCAQAHAGPARRFIRPIATVFGGDEGAPSSAHCWGQAIK